MPRKSEVLSLWDQLCDFRLVNELPCLSFCICETGIIKVYFNRGDAMIKENVFKHSIKIAVITGLLRLGALLASPASLARIQILPLLFSVSSCLNPLKTFLVRV